jgi:hypothetical protein
MMIMHDAFCPAIGTPCQGIPVEKFCRMTPSAFCLPAAQNYKLIDSMIFLSARTTTTATALERNATASNACIFVTAQVWRTDASSSLPGACISVTKALKGREKAVARLAVQCKPSIASGRR